MLDGILSDDVMDGLIQWDGWMRWHALMGSNEWMGSMGWDCIG